MTIKINNNFKMNNSLSTKTFKSKSNWLMKKQMKIIE